MNKLLWRLLMWSWCRAAKRRYAGPGELGELFNTASFQATVKETTDTMPDGRTVCSWLTAHGLGAGRSGCHWWRIPK
jgi:hypothetical protein